MPTPFCSHPQQQPLVVLVALAVVARAYAPRWAAASRVRARLLPLRARLWPAAG